MLPPGTQDLYYVECQTRDLDYVECQTAINLLWLLLAKTKLNNNIKNITEKTELTMSRKDSIKYLIEKSWM